MTDDNFDCDVDLALSVLQILYITMHVIELQDIVSHCCNTKVSLQGEINIVCT